MRLIGKATVAILWLASLVGCNLPGPQPRTATTLQASRPQDDAGYLPRAAVRTHERIQGSTAVETAMELARQLAKNTEKADQLQKENERLKKKNETLMVQVARFQADLVQTQKELAEANAMLIEFRQELVQWKLHVLGKSKDIRDGQSAIIEALTRVLRLLGGEIPAPRPTTQPVAGTPPERKELSRAPAE